MPAMRRNASEMERQPLELEVPRGTTYEIVLRKERVFL